MFKSVEILILDICNATPKEEINYSHPQAYM